MCGICGIVAHNGSGYDQETLREALEVLGRHSQVRGKDSSGLVVRDEAEATLRVYKGATPLTSLLEMDELRALLDRALERYDEATDASFSVMGHSRLVTNGSQLQHENNQPVVKSGLVGIHNGIIVNDSELWERNAALTREHEIDTEVMLALIREKLKWGWTLPAAMARVEAETEGTISTAVLFADRPELLLAANNGSLYTLTNGHDLLFFASEQYPLRVVANDLHIGSSNEFEIRQVVSRSGVVLNLDSFELSSFAFEEALHQDPRGTRSGERLEYRIEEIPLTDGRDQGELVLDVAHIAAAPEAVPNEGILEWNQEEIAELQRCSRCVLPSTFPFIEFDAQGLCNYCRNYQLTNQPKPLDELRELIEPYRCTGEKPDCIVPFSGGRDSTFALHTICTKLDLNPIAFTYDWGMVTDLARRNIARVCGKLGVENIIVAADIHKKRENIRKNITAWLEKPHLGMVPLFMAGDKWFYYYVDQVKEQTGIDLNIWGINPLENTDFKVGFLDVPPDFEKERIYSLSMTRQLKLFYAAMKAIASNPRYLNGSILDTLGGFFSRSIKPHADYFHLYDYVRWDEEMINEVLLGEYDWEKAIDTTTTWRIGDGTAAFYNYIYYTVAGFSEHDTFRSNQIREGMITRDDALRLLNDENRPRYPTIKWYLDIVGIDYAHAIHTINSIPKLYS